MLKLVVLVMLPRRTNSMLSAKTSPDVVTVMLNVFLIDASALFDPGASLSFFTPLAAKKF